MTRREMAAGMLAAPAALRAKPSQPRVRVGFPVPHQACDTHTHIFGDPARFPWFAGRSYTPEQATPAELKKLHGKLHIERVVIVQPSVYGTDNAAMLFGLRSLGLKRARGIAVVDARASAAELLAMDKAGVRGVRINHPMATGEMFDAAIARVKKMRGWHLQLYTGLAAVRALKARILDSPAPVVIDHLADALPEEGPGQAGFAELVEVVRAGKAYVKLTHNFLSRSKSPMFEDAEVLGRALLRANPDRVLWGTDWPHPDSSSGRKPEQVSPLKRIDDGRLLNHCASWMQLDLKRVLVDNPAALYGW